MNLTNCFRLLPLLIGINTVWGQGTSALIDQGPIESVISNESPNPWNADESKVAPYTLPDALLCDDGSLVEDVKTWQAKRRGEILRSFSANMYGHTPDTAIDHCQRTIDYFLALAPLATSSTYSRSHPSLAVIR